VFATQYSKTVEKADYWQLCKTAFLSSIFYHLYLTLLTVKLTKNYKNI